MQKEPKELLYKVKGALQCSNCDSANLETRLCYDGFTSHEYELSIVCNSCGYITLIARLTTDSCKVIEIKEFPNQRAE